MTKNKSVIKLVQFQFIHSRWVCPKPYYGLVPLDGWGALVTLGTTWKYNARNFHHGGLRIWQTIIVTEIREVDWLPRFEPLNQKNIRPVKPTRGELVQWRDWIKKNQRQDLVNRQVPRWLWERSKR